MKNIKTFTTVSKILFTLFLFTFLTTGCDKKKGCTNPVALNFNADAEDDDGSCLVAGLGGKTKIVAFPQHHGVPIKNYASYRDTAYIKFNTSEFPGISPSAYDAIFIGEHTGEDHVHIEGLKPGQYYIYMVGWDASISERVTGGIPYILTAKTGEVDVNVPVTE